MQMDGNYIRMQIVDVVVVAVQSGRIPEKGRKIDVSSGNFLAV